MKRVLLVALLCCSGFVVGCAKQEHVQALHAEITAIERQRVQQENDVVQQLKTFDARLAELERTQAEARRELAKSIAASEELRVATQRLSGTMQEAQHHMQRRGTPSAEMHDLLATKLAEVNARVKDLESRFGTTPSTTSEVPPAAPQQRPTDPATSTQLPAPSQPKPPRETSGTAAYQRALQEYQRGNYEVAIVLFKQFLRQHPKSIHAAQVQYWIGESLYAQRQYEAAIVAFDEVIQKYPRHTQVPTALLKQGYAFAELKDLRNARFFLQQVKKKYPQSSEARQAEEKLQQLKQRQG